MIGQSDPYKAGSLRSFQLTSFVSKLWGHGDALFHVKRDISEPDPQFDPRTVPAKYVSHPKKEIHMYPPVMHQLQCFDVSCLFFGMSAVEMLFSPT